MGEVKLIATDLDGTFLKSDRSISEENIEALQLLGTKHIIRVIATGRNLKKVMDVIPSDVPFDYIVFSSGAGIYDCKGKKHIYSRNISPGTSNGIIQLLVDEGINFNAFMPVPGNSYFWHHRGNKVCGEFERYLEYNDGYASSLPNDKNAESGLSQFLVIFPNDESLFNKLKIKVEKLFPEVRAIRATSPLGTGYIWMELFHKDVSKGNGIAHLCEIIGVHHGQTMGIGNDYNDIDLLNFTNYSYLVENAPEELKPHFENAPSNEDHAFSIIVKRLLGIS
ncbi:hypothetical protein MNBD_BACTEROID01-2337 [hydrothermal vent metagenome]|uniref:HAD family phosphatase n=1 Tax=hydrothermal vent metagenome TaxID=652676 RepID=A0A3B0TT55_9ZZZZ